MKKILAITAICCLLLSTAAFADVEKRGSINSSATSYKELTPDTVEISIAVVTYDNKSMQKATQQNKEISDKVYNTMKSMINTQNGDYVKTSDFSAQPIYTYTNNKRILDKYQVSNRIIVHTKAIDKAGSLIDKAILLGATNIDNLNFTLSSYENQCDELLVTATKKTRARADKMAAAAGTMVTGVQSISGSCNTAGANRRVMYNMMAKSMTMDAAEPEAAMGSSVPIETGTVKLNANVNANYFVK